MEIKLEAIITICFFLFGIFPVESSTQDYTCGQSVVQKIIRGTAAERGQFPWMASLVLAKDHSSVQCGAALINRRYAVTAKHCTMKSPSQHNLLLGTVDLTKIDSDSQIIKIEKYIQYSTLNSDLALIKLRKVVKLSQYIQPICLPPANHDFSNVQAAIAGFGETNPLYDTTGISLPTNVLLSGVVTVTSTEHCNNVMYRYNDPITDDFLCAGSYAGEPDHCYGDSGGPLMYYDQKSMSWQLIAVISSGYDCGNVHDYSFYVNVTHFSDWILSNSKY